ncbi:MAG: EAL domain-containing protein [Thermodesulfovibrionales bacterium]
MDRTDKRKGLEIMAEFAEMCRQIESVERFEGALLSLAGKETGDENNAEERALHDFCSATECTVVNRAGEIVVMSESLMTLFRAAPGMRYEAVWEKAFEKRALDAEAPLREIGALLNGEKRRVIAGYPYAAPGAAPSRTVCWFLLYSIPLRAVPGGAIVLHIDITDWKSDEEDARKNGECYCSIVENQNELICRFLPDGTLTYVNDSFSAYFKKAKEELVGKPFLPFAPEEDLRNIEYHLSQLGKVTPSMQYEHRFLIPGKGDIEVRWLRWSAKVLYDAAGETAEIQAVGWDITDNKLLEERLLENEYQLNHLAHHDPLTGLPNRMYFTNRLQQEVVRCRRYSHAMAVLFLDLDNFKKINDSLGHDVGDLLLKEAAERIRSCLRASDVVSRLGGDEFTIILPELEKNGGAAVVAQKIIGQVSRPFLIGQYDLYITVSIGIALYRLDGEDGDSLVKNADTAMYHAKSLDKNNYQFYNARMNTVTVERLALESELRKALENNEFVLYYQPQICIKSGQIIGVEALIRWQHPVRGMVPPMRFIPVAEETGLIIPISEWVIRTACAQNREWQKKGFPSLTMAVNISMKHFKQSNLLDLIDGTLRETKLDAVCLELELTESIVMHNIEAVIGILRKFRERGVHVSIDDFGTGYSSLNYLKRLPINKLKVDQTFVRNITADCNDAMIVKTVIEMAHNLGLKVIAEGVETLEQVDFLRSLACDELQGYFFSKPLPAEECVKLLEVLRFIS